MPSLPQLPPTAPFRPEEIAALNGVITKSSPEQRAWLSGFLAGYQAATGPVLQPALAAPAHAAAKKVPLLILYATESGNSETLAANIRKASQKLGFAPRVADVADITPTEAAKAENLLLIAATWGEGDPPQRATDFLQALQAEDAPRFDKTRFSVLALGDRAYVNFCSTGHLFDERLAALGGTRLAPAVECDVDFEKPAAAWIKSALETLKKETIDKAAPADESAVIHVDFARGGAGEEDEAEPAYTRNTPFEAEIRELINLNGTGSSAETWHAELSLEGSGLAHEPGDALGIVPRNDPALVDEILVVAGLAGDAMAQTALTEAQDITTLTRPQVEAYAKLTDSAALKTLAADVDALKAWLPGRQVIDLLAAAPMKLDASQLTSLLRPLPGRLYSVASSPYSLRARPISWLPPCAGSRTATSAGASPPRISPTAAASATRFSIYVKPNRHFRLPEDGARPIVMIGAGTGVAPYRAFIEERVERGPKARTGSCSASATTPSTSSTSSNGRSTSQAGALSRIDVAFSRDQPEKIYVQQRLWEHRAELLEWIATAPHIYVCGDEKGMGRDGT